MRSIRSRLTAVAVGSLAAVAAIATPVGAIESSPSPQSIFPGCAWGSDWGEVINPDTLLANPALNVGEPDNSANYWKLDYTYEPGETITLNGTFPDARFQSFQVYVAPGHAFPNSVLTDYEIAPDRGSINPFQPGSDPWPPIEDHHGGRPGEHYTVTLSSDAQPGETNTLPLGPPGQEAGASDLVMMRDYLQTGGEWAVPAPSVTFSYDGVSKLVPPCTREQETFPGSTSSDAAASALPAASVTHAAPTPTGGSPGEIVAPFWETTVGPSANLDTQYLEAIIRPPANGEVLVVKGKFLRPSTAPGRSRGPSQAWTCATGRFATSSRARLNRAWSTNSRMGRSIGAAVTTTGPSCPAIASTRSSSEPRRSGERSKGSRA